MTLGENIKTYREQAGLSREELGEKLSVSAETVDAWETGESTPTIDDLLRLKEVFGVSADQLLNVGTSALDAVSFPKEVYRLHFTQDEWKKIIKAMQKQAQRKPIVLMVLLVLLLCYSLLFSMPATGSCFIVGIIFVFAIFNLRYATATKKSYENAKDKLVGNTYEYKVFEDYLEIHIYRGGEQVRNSKLSFDNLERFFDIGEYILVQNAGQVFALRKSNLKADSFFFTYPKAHPEKFPFARADQKQRFVSGALITLSFAALLFASPILEKLGIPNSWILYIFAVFPVASVIYGVVAKIKGYKKYILNLVVGFICAILLLVFGSYCFIF